MSGSSRWRPACSPPASGPVPAHVLLTVIASAVYRLFAQPLRGYERAQARQLFCRFLDTTARVTITEQEVTVHLPRRAHNPILLDAGLFGAPAPIPWWDGRPLRIELV